jgi:hypothetical protein
VVFWPGLCYNLSNIEEPADKNEAFEISKEESQ